VMAQPTRCSKYLRARAARARQATSPGASGLRP